MSARVVSSLARSAFSTVLASVRSRVIFESLVNAPGVISKGRQHSLGPELRAVLPEPPTLGAKRTDMARFDKSLFRLTFPAFFVGKHERYISPDHFLQIIAIQPRRANIPTHDTTVRVKGKYGRLESAINKETETLRFALRLGALAVTDRRRR